MLIIHLLAASLLVRFAAPFVRRVAAVNDLRNPKLVGPVSITKQEKVTGCWLPEEVPALEKGDLEVLKRGQERFQVIESALYLAPKPRGEWPHSMN